VELRRRRHGRFLRLLELPGFRLLFFSTFASSFGTLLAAVALAVDVKDRTNSGLWVGALMVVEFLPTILVGLAFGPLLDRFSRRGLMVAADLVRAAAFCALPFAGGAGTIVALAALAGLATGFFRPAAYAGIPNLVPDDDLPQANSLIQGVENVSWTIGPVVGGVIAAVAGPHAAYWINAATFLISAALIVRIPSRLLQSVTALTRGYWRDLGDGFLIVRRSRPLLLVLVAWSVAMIASGLANVAEVFLAKDTFNAGDFGFGLLFGAIGTGLVLGSLLGATLVERFGLRVFYGFSMAIFGLGYGLAAASPNVWVAAVCCVVAGMGNGGANLANLLLVQRGTGDAMRGRALTVVMSVNYVVLGMSMAAAGPAVDTLGPRWTWAIAAGALACAGAIALTLGRGAGLEAERRREASVELEVTA
jgi:MFS family permease